MIDLAAIEAQAEADRDALRASLLPPDRALLSLPAVVLGGAESSGFRAGQAVAVPQEGSTGLVRVYGPGNDFLGVGELSGDGELAPRRVFKSSEKTP
jgi:tRNA pseudouridine55 synthase